MKNKSFWGILLFVGMFLVAGVGFMGCEKNNGPSGGGGSSSDGNGGGGSTLVNDSLEHCWELIISYTYEGKAYKDTAYAWATQKEILREDSAAKAEGVTMTYKLSTAQTEGECDAMNMDPNSERCWEITYKYKGENQSYTEYAWTTLKEVQEWQKEAAKSGMTMTYKANYDAYDEDACEDLNSSGPIDPEPSVPAVYIKHPWGTGLDASWSWEKMDYDSYDEYYYYVGDWGGVGANINSEPSDAGATWFSANSIYGASDLYVGQMARFVYYASDGTLYVYAY